MIKMNKNIPNNIKTKVKEIKEKIINEAKIKRVKEIKVEKLEEPNEENDYLLFPESTNIKVKEDHLYFPESVFNYNPKDTKEYHDLFTNYLAVKSDNFILKKVILQMNKKMMYVTEKIDSLHEKNKISKDRTMSSIFIKKHFPTVKHTIEDITFFNDILILYVSNSACSCEEEKSPFKSIKICISNKGIKSSCMCVDISEKFQYINIELLKMLIFRYPTIKTYVLFYNKYFNMMTTLKDPIINTLYPQNIFNTEFSFFQEYAKYMVPLVNINKNNVDYNILIFPETNFLLKRKILNLFADKYI